MSCSVQHKLVVAWPVLDAITDVPIGCAPWSMPSHPTDDEALVVEPWDGRCPC